MKVSVNQNVGLRIVNALVHVDQFIALCIRIKKLSVKF